MILGVEEWLFWVLFGVVLGCVAFIILIINLWVCYCQKWYKTNEKRAMLKEEGLVELQTSRTVGGENMSQVIFKSQPSGTMDKVNENNMPYRTMDPETNTVRYETAHHEGMKISYNSHDSGVAGSPASSGHHESIIQEPEDSPSSAQAAADVHISFNDPAPSEQGYTNKAAEFSDSGSDADSTYRKPYYSMPPAPISAPPPLTPGTPPSPSPIPFEESFSPPLAPPLPPTPAPASEEPPMQEVVYASINKRRQTQEQNTSADVMMANVWRPRDSSEIQIIEK